MIKIFNFNSNPSEFCNYWARQKETLNGFNLPDRSPMTVRVSSYDEKMSFYNNKLCLISRYQDVMSIHLLYLLYPHKGLLVWSARELLPYFTVQNSLAPHHHINIFLCRQAQIQF